MHEDLLSDIAAAVRSERTLLVLPCCAQKATRGTASPPPGSGVLDGLPSPLAAELRAARRRNAEAAGVDERHPLPAIDRYTGTLYQALGDAARDRLGRGPAVILSGGYGLVEPTEPIGWYEQRLQPGRWPGGLLSRALAAYAEHHACDAVVALVSATGPYPQIVRRARWPATVATAWLVGPTDVGGGAMVKTPRALGEALEAACRSRLSSAWRSSDGVALDAMPLRSVGSGGRAG